MSLGKVSQFKNLSFKGYDKSLDKSGKEVHTFYYPHSDKYDLQLELLKKKGEDNAVIEVYDISDDKKDIKGLDNLGKDSEVFYRFKLIDNSYNGKDAIYANDNGLLKNFGEVNGSTAPFNQIFTDRKIISKEGRMQLQVPDMYYPGMEYDGSNYVINDALRAKALSSTKTHVGKLGGTLDGMIAMLPTKAKEGYTRIVGTPFTKDEISSHLYWTQNAYQMASSVGGLQTMKRFQQALFKNGINFVSDAALVNEGLQGIHFANVMKWGQDSPFFTWFKTYDLDSNILNLGVIPKDYPYAKMKIINSPVNLPSNPVENGKYNPKMPTYVQLYDSRLVTEEQEKADKVFNKYDKSTDNHYEITSFKDAIYPYAFEVNPKELVANINKFGAYNKGDFSDKNTIMNILNFSKFKIGERQEGGIELWDGNVDIAKLNFSFGNYDFTTMNKDNGNNPNSEKDVFKQGIREVQDYAVLSGKYWAKLSADTQLEYAASAFKDVNNADEALSSLQSYAGVILPKSVLKKDIANDIEIINNVFNNNYDLFKLKNISSYTHIDNNDKKTTKAISSYNDVLTKSIMNLPLETLEVSDDVAAILSSGYLTKRAGTDEQIGLTRFDIYKSDYPNLPKKYEELYKRTDNLLSNGVYGFIDKVLSTYDNLDNIEHIKDNDGNLTTYGKYLINAVTPDLTKYALLKSLDNDAEIPVTSDGGLNFDNIDRQKLNVKMLGIQDYTPEQEAENLISKFEDGLDKLSFNQSEINKLVKAMAVRFNGMNENSFKLADMIMDRTESGIGLRVDAAKDVAAIDSAREGKDNIAKAWSDTINFWTKYVKDGIQAENPHAFSTAEVTDIDKFILNYAVDDLESASAADRAMLEKTGVTSIANYSYLFAMPTGMYSYNPETGYWDGYKIVNNIKAKLDALDTPDWKDNLGMLYQGPADSSIHSYTFSGNHDKPRILHVLGLDMALYNSDFSDEKSQKIAYEVLKLDEKSDFSVEDITLSAPAIAMGKRLKDVFTAMKLKQSESELAKINKQKAQCTKNKTEYIPENDSENNEDRVLSDNDYEKIENAISRLASGIYQIGEKNEKTTFNPDSFGQKPFDVVINDVIKTADLDLSEKDTRQIANIALKKMLAPAMEKYKSIYKMLTLLPGDTTDFAGDKEAMTGFEAKCKNITQQNRNAIRWEWIDKNDKSYKSFVDEYKKSLDNIMKLRTKPELSALNNGHTVSLINYTTPKELDNAGLRKFAANFRYNAQGSQVITIFGTPDISDEPNPNKPMGSKTTSIEFLNLSSAREREGLSAGLKENTVFVNANDNDDSTYIVEKQQVAVPKVYEGKYNDLEVELPNYDKKIGYVSEYKDTFVLKRYDKDGNPINIEVGKNDDNALVLYKKQ